MFYIDVVTSTDETAVWEDSGDECFAVECMGPEPLNGLRVWRLFYEDRDQAVRVAKAWEYGEDAVQEER